MISEIEFNSKLKAISQNLFEAVPLTSFGLEYFICLNIHPKESSLSSNGDEKYDFFTLQNLRLLLLANFLGRFFSKK